MDVDFQYPDDSSRTSIENFSCTISCYWTYNYLSSPKKTLNDC